MENVSDQKAQNYYFLARWFTSKTMQVDLEYYLELIQEMQLDEKALMYQFKEVITELLGQNEIDLELPQEYTKLFVLPDGVKPYESVYRGEGNKLMQEPWVEVKSFYQKRGWQMDKSIYPEDHVSVELSFMGHLLAAGEKEDAIVFFKDHIIKWIPILMKDIMDNEYANYYKKVAEYGLSYLKSEDKLYQ